MQKSYEGELTVHDNKKHLPFYFELDEGVTKLELDFSYHPIKVSDAQPTNQVSLSLFDPFEARGARHNNADQSIILTETRSSAGYTAGPLHAGRWSVVIDIHRILPDIVVNYKLDIKSSSTIIEDPCESSIWQKGYIAPKGAGWYRGDLHAHSLHSDARWDVCDLINFAKTNKLDFVSLTDHNTVSALAEFHSYADNDLVTLGGLELTTYYGHALALGTHKWLEWRVQPHDKASSSMAELARGIRDAGAHFVIAHPKSMGDPWCTGCDWQYEDMMPGSARMVEVWNSFWAGKSNNEAGLQLFYSWLNQGHKLVATAGTDSHAPPQANALLGFNVVYAEAFSETAILSAIAKGHLFISGGPSLALTAITSAGHFMMGDTVTGQQAQLNVQWSDCETGDQLRLIANGEVLKSISLDAAGSLDFELASKPNWCSIEIRDSTGNLRALSNPLFFS